MSDDRRNPYLILGVPYGTTRADATRAFAQRSRRAKRSTTFPYTVEDLTWALHQVEANLDDPTIAIDHFRVPADPAQLHPPDGPGVLRPPAVPLERRTEPASASSIELLRQQAVEEASETLLAQAAANGQTAYIPAKPLQPADIRPQTPLKPRPHLWPWFVAGILIIALAVTASTVVYLNSDETESAPAPTTPSTTTSTSTTTTTTIAPPPTLGDEITQASPSGPLNLRPTAPVNAFGFLCIVFEVSGSPPFFFVPELSTIAIASADPWPVFAADPTVATGRAPTGIVFGDTEPTNREACWPADGVQEFGGLLSYLIDDVTYQWVIPPGT